MDSLKKTTTDVEPKVQLIMEALDELKASDLALLEVAHLTPIADIFIIATSRSTRHARALFNHVSVRLKQAGYQTQGFEGLNSLEWILIDFGSVLVHIMEESARRLYDLESLWGIEDEG